MTTKKKPEPKKAPPQKKQADAELPVTGIQVVAGDNPRQDFDRVKMKQLVDSIKVEGLLQPILVRRDDDGNVYLVAGERRLRAHKLLKRKTVPVCWFTGTEVDAMFARAQENMQRDDLNELEEAQAYKLLLGQKVMVGKKSVPLTAKTLATRFGKSQGHISQRLKLLELPTEVQTALRKGTFAFTQARELLTVEGSAQQLKLFRQLMKGGPATAKDVKKAAEKTRATKAAKKPRGRAATKANAEDAVGKPNIQRQGLDTALERLKKSKVAIRKVKEVRVGISTVYERHSRAKSDDRKTYLKGMADALEWAGGLREDL